MKKLVSLFLVLMVGLSALPVSALAEESALSILAAAESVVQEAEAAEENEINEISAEVEIAVEMKPAEEADASEAIILEGEEQAQVLQAGVVDSGICGSALTWSLSEDGVLTISGTGNMNSFSASAQPWSDYRDRITALVVVDGVTSIGNYAFYFCQSITTAELPDSLEEIGSYAFEYCSALEDIDLPEAVDYIGKYAFAYCEQLKTIEIPENVSSISPYTFRECKNLSSVTLPEGLIFIGEFAFGHCDALERIAIPVNVNTVDVNAFYSCYGLKEVEYQGTDEQWYAMDILGGNACLWAACPYAIPVSGLCGENVRWTVEDGVLTISGEGAMADYDKAIYAPWYDLTERITAVKIGNGVTYVGSYLLENSSVLREITLAESVETIGSYAFRNCTEVASVTLPQSVTEVKANAFRACYGVITVLNRECAIGSNALGYGEVRGYYGSTAWVYTQEGYNEFLPIDENIPVNERVFPDENFRAYVLTLAGDDGALSPEERTNVTAMDCSGREIASLTGLEFFPELKELDCADNALTEIDLTANTKLETLDCSDNELAALNVQSCAGLTELSCVGCGLAVLDVSGCPELSILDCRENAFSTLNLRKNPPLKALVEEHKPVVTGDTAVYSAEGLTLTMDAEVYIESGAVGQLLAIDEVNFPDSSFRAYIRGEITSYSTGESLFTGDANQDGYLSDEELAAVTEIDVSGVYWEEGTCKSLEGIEYFGALEILNCGYQGLTDLDLTGNPKLREVIAYKSGLKTIDLTGCPELEVFKCYHTSIAELDLSCNPKLKYLNASEINLTALDVTGCPALEILNCGGNRIEKLDVSQNPNLVELHCYNTLSYSGFAGLTELDVSNCPNLEYLDICMNAVSELDVSDNSRLTTLVAYSNQLEELVVSKNTKLTRLECNDNQFTMLDISRIPALLDAYANGQKIHETTYETGEAYTVHCVGNYDSRTGNILVVDDDVTVITENPSDVTGEGDVSTADLVLLMQYILGLTVELAPDTGDVNGDEQIDILDIICLVRKLADG